MIDMSKYLVTGGAGFIGKYIVDLLVEQGNDVIVYDIAKDKRDDIMDLPRLTRKMKGCDGVFHLAAIPSVQYSITNPEETYQVNLKGTINVLEAMRISGVNNLVYSSSSAVYGDQDVLPINENADKNYKSPYALQKYIGELISKSYTELYGIKVISLRYFNVYGKGQSSEGAYASVIAKFIDLKMSGKPLTITGDGKQTRDFVHVTDVARANVISMKRINKIINDSFNIGSGESISVNEISNIIGGDRVYIDSRIEPKNSKADISKAIKILKWAPKVNFRKGLLNLIKSL